MVCAGVRNHGLGTIPIARGACSFYPDWLAAIVRIGKGGKNSYFYDLYLLLVVSASGVTAG